MKTFHRHAIIAAGLFAGIGAAQADLVGHWKLDEGAGTNYADTSPNGNDAFPNTIWSTDVPPTGFANTASLSFDGLIRYVSTPYAGIGGNAPRTVAFWVKTDVNTNHGIVAWGLSTANGEKWHIRVNSNAGNGPLGAIRTESQGDFTIGSTVLTDGEWHHVASVYPEGAGELATVQHYIDGALEVVGANNTNTPAVNTNTAADPVTIGRRTQGTAQNYYNGLIDDVRIYDRALTAQEIADLSGNAPTEDGLVFYMPFEEGSGDTTDDLGSGGNDGMLIGAGGVLPTWSTDAPPHLSNSLEFANVEDHLVTDYPGIAGTASRSVTFWFRADPSVSSLDNGMLAWGDSTGNGLKWHVRINTGAADGPVGALRLEIQGGRTVATTPVADGMWHHAAFVFEEDADPDIEDVVFYLDGEIDPVSMFTSVPINTSTSGASSAPVWIGGREQARAIRGFIGNLADVRIYDTGLTQEEVQEIMGGAGQLPLQLDVSVDGGDLTIGWESRDGMLYNLRSETDPSNGEPVTWPIFDGQQDLAATPPLNSVTFPLPADAERFFVVEEFPAPPMRIYFDDFENGPGEWTAGSDGDAGTVWELGTPSNVGPPSAYSPANCFATNVSAAYTLEANVWLRSPAIDLTTAGGATLNYFEFRDIEPPGPGPTFYDSGTVSVLDAADDSVLAVIQAGIAGDSTDWQPASYTIPSAALGRTIKVEFRLDTDNLDVISYAGWYIDDVEVTVP